MRGAGLGCTAVVLAGCLLPGAQPRARLGGRRQARGGAQLACRHRQGVARANAAAQQAHAVLRGGHRGDKAAAGRGGERSHRARHALGDAVGGALSARRAKVAPHGHVAVLCAEHHGRAPPRGLQWCAHIGLV